MRPIWKGFISLGLINIPIELYSGEKKTAVSFKLIDSRDKAKIRYERINEETGKEVPWSEVVKAYEYDDNQYVIVNEEDIKNAEVKSSQTIDIEDFIDINDVDVTYFEKPYYLVPGKRGDKGYVLFRETLRNTQTVAIAKVVIRTRQYLAAILIVGNALVLNIMRFAKELRKPEEFDIPKGGLKEYKVTPKELEMAEQLVESMKVKWKPEKYHDDFREAMLKWIEKKAKRGTVEKPAPPEEIKETKVIDFMDLLKKSLKKTKKPQRGSKRKVSRSRKTTAKKARRK